MKKWYMIMILSSIMSVTIMTEASMSITNQEQSAPENRQQNISRKRMIAALGLLLNAFLFSDIIMPSSTPSWPQFHTITFWINPYTPPITPIVPTYTYTPFYF